MTVLDRFAGAVPQFFPAHWLTDAPDLAFTEFASRIRVGYVVSVPGGYTYLMRPALEEAGVTLPQLHEFALENLADLPGGDLAVAMTPGGPEVCFSDVDDHFRAARILRPEVQEVLAETLGDEFLVAIPCRDWCLCWSRTQSADWQARNIAQAREDFLEDEHRLTPDILLRSGTGFSVHLQQQVDQ